MEIKRNNKSFGLFNSLFRYAPQRIEQSKKHTQKVRNYYCEKLGIYNCEKLGKLNLLFTFQRHWRKPDGSLLGQRSVG